MRPAAPRRLVDRTVIETFVDDEPVRVETMPVGEIVKRLSDRISRPSDQSGIALEQPRPFVMVAGLADAAAQSVQRVPGSVEIFRQNAGSRLEEARRRQTPDLGGSREEPLLSARFEPSDHRLEEVHVRVLEQGVAIGRKRGVIAARGRGEMPIEVVDGLERGFEKARIGLQTMGPGKAEKREGVRVEIPPGVVDGAFMRRREDPARPSVRREMAD